MTRLSVVIFVVAVCASLTFAQIRSVPDKDSANILTVAKNTPDPTIKIEPVTGFPEKTSLVLNRAKTFKAFILCLPGTTETSSIARVFFTDSKSGETFMIAGEPSEAEITRPIDDLKWVDNDRLSYERWMNPHFGRRYVVNVKLKKQTGSFIISDTQ